jgi:hypothetical protein
METGRNSPSSDSGFRAYLLRPTVSLATVVASSDFLSESRAGNPTLFGYLFTPETFSSILSTVFAPTDWTTLHTSLADFLTSDSAAIQSALSESAVLASFLPTFLSDSHPNHRNSRLSGIACRLVAHLLRRSPERWSVNLPNLVTFLSRNLALVSYRTLLEDLAIASPALVPRTSEFYESLLTTSPSLPHAVQLIHGIAKKSADFVPLLASPAIARRLLEAAADPHHPRFFSLRALEVVAKLAKCAGIRAVVDSFERSFDAVADIADCRLAVLLSLFPARASRHLDAFVASRTPTAYDAALVAAFRRLEPAQFAAIVEQGAFLSAATEALGASKVNGHVGALLRVLHERRELCETLQSAEWAEFVDGTLLPHLQQAAASYGGPYPQRAECPVPFSPSADALETALPDSRLSSSSGSASDDDSGPVHRVGLTARSPGPAPIAGFDFVGQIESVVTLPAINASALPSLGAVTSAPERRQRRRNAGSVTLADLPRGIRV